jgi:hypothetical protein
MVEYFSKSTIRSTTCDELAVLAGRIATQLEKHQHSDPRILPAALSTPITRMCVGSLGFTPPAG